MEINLELNGHCIETAAKTAYERLLNKYFNKSTPENTKLHFEDQIEGLGYFLENADFGYLRAHYKDLNGSRHSQVVLVIPEEPSEMEIHCGGRKLYMKIKNH